MYLCIYVAFLIYNIFINYLYLVEYTVMFLIVSCTMQIALGTVTNIDEAIQWLNYTYLVIRMRKNPIVYGMSYNDLEVRWLSELLCR